MTTKKKPAPKKAPPKPETALVPATQVLTDDELQELLDQQMAGVEPTFPEIRILHGGAEQFRFEDGEKVTEISAVILDRHQNNAYWKSAYAGGNEPPDCASRDGVRGEGDPGGLCAECPLNLFGTAVGKDGKAESGKACKNMERLYLLEDPADDVPKLLVVPPTSLQVVWNYVTLLRTRRIPVQGVFTRFTLTTRTNRYGDFSGLVLQRDPDRRLEAEEFKRLLRMRQGFLPAMRAREVQAADYGGDPAPKQEPRAAAANPKNGGGTAPRRPARRKL